MTYLHQVIAVIKKLHSDYNANRTEIYKKVQKGTLFNTFTKVFTPKEEEGTVYPPEGTSHIPFSVEEMMREFSKSCSTYINHCYAQDVGNTLAKADLVVDGITIIRDCPIAFLIGLEDFANDWYTFVNHLPTLDIDKRWVYDEGQGRYISDPVTSLKMKTVKVPHVVVEATEKHPAQYTILDDSRLEGTWTTTHYSTAIPARHKQDMLDRVNNLKIAIRAAIQLANRIEVDTPDVYSNLAKYVLG